MKLTFLGTGTSTGVPTIRCHCRVCSSTDPRDKRLRASALVTSGDTRLLIDCGPDFRQQILSVGSPDLTALLITHIHYDHVGGIEDLRPYCAHSGFDIYCKSDVDLALRERLPYCFASPEGRYPGAPVFDVTHIEPLKPFMIGDLKITPLPLRHYIAEIVGFKIGDLAYITDAKEIPDATIDAIRSVDTLVINALRITSHPSHINLYEALDVIRVVKPRVAYLTHMSHDMGLHAEVSRQLPDNVRFAYDGLTIDVR